MKTVVFCGGALRHLTAGSHVLLVALMAHPVAGEEHFAADENAISIYRALARSLIKLEGVRVVVSKSQVAFRVRRGFAYAWAPSRYVNSAVPLVVSIALREKLASSRFKEVAHPSPHTWMHHAELRSVADVDAELAQWLERAYEEACIGPALGDLS